ncbi:hydroxyisourate hydrolase [Effusibacillus consociatus]|uniref:5-hydroxyisourate hydrolase n=1 Tax=Effusibacillus consociatus TaxID=1117041 RepID=A0ABV9PXF7_9BACL
MKGRLTTHVLDLVNGRPTPELQIQLYRVDSEGTRIHIRSVRTNSDGRVDGPVLSDSEFKPGIYELLFFVADYFRTKGVPLPDPPFLDVVPIRFGIADPNSHYHVPLLISPWGYSTYRGS